MLMHSHDPCSMNPVNESSAGDFIALKRESDHLAAPLYYCICVYMYGVRSVSGVPGFRFSVLACVVVIAYND